MRGCLVAWLALIEAAAYPRPVLTVLSAWREGLNTIAGWLGVRSYPPAVLFAVGILFILAVLLFSYGMRAVYIESCTLFVRGGVYRIVKEALGGTAAKTAVSA